MGSQLKGPFGGFSGKTGPLPGIIARGKSFITSLHTPSKKTPTQRQLDQRNKFGLVTSQLAYFSDLIDIGFRDYSVAPMNLAVSYNLENAVTRDSPNFTINFSKLSFSRGKLAAPRNVAAESVADAKMVFTWTASDNVQKLTHPADMLMVLIYNPAKQDCITSINAAKRADLTCTIQLPLDFAGDEVHCYVAFEGIEGKVSDSIYVGAVEMIA